MARRNNPKQKKAASAARLAAGSIYLLRINYNTIRDREVVYTLRYSLYSTKGLAFFKLFMTATPKKKNCRVCAWLRFFAARRARRGPAARGHEHRGPPD